MMEESPIKKRKLNKTEKSRSYFDFVAKENDKYFYTCKICKNKINGTKNSNFVSHLKNHKDVYAQICSEDTLIEKKRLNLLLNCVELVTVNGRPLKSLNDSAIISMNEILLNELKLAGREVALHDKNLTEVKSMVLDISNKVRDEIRLKIKNKPLSLMVDIGTNGGRSFLGMSIQAIINGEIFIAHIGMIHLHGSHTAEYNSDVVVKQLKEFGIDGRQIISITTDNGSNMLKMVRDMDHDMQQLIGEPESIPQTPKKSKQNATHGSQSSNIIDEEAIDREIGSLLEEDLTEEQAYALLFDAYDDDDEVDDCEANELILGEITNLLVNTHGMALEWMIMGINCAAHTKQLSIGDAVKTTTKANQNVIKLCGQVARILRRSSTKNRLDTVPIGYNLPRLQVKTRWCSLYLMMHDVLQCKRAIEYLANTVKDEHCALILKKWHVMKELVAVLRVSYKATVALQSRSLTLSDTYGIWLKVIIFLESPELKRICKTNFAKCLLDAMNQRKHIIFENPAMLCSIYLDPRYRSEILRDNEKTEKAIHMLSQLWTRTEFLRQCESDEMLNVSNQSGSSDISFDFNDPGILTEYLSRDIVNTRVNIRMELELFQPESLQPDENIISYWETQQKDNPILYQLSKIIYGIPPTEVEIERGYSNLNFVFSQRRRSISEDLLSAILLIHLNSQIFFIIKERELKSLS